VISADGLTVLSHSGVDPSRAYGRFGLKIDVATSDVKIVLADGTEHEADLVLTDKDLDLAFVRPKGPVKLPCVEMKKTDDPALLDQLVSITRMGRKANREPGVAISEVLSILHKPRVRYMVSGQIFQGCPVFKASGEVLGMALVQADTGLSVLPCDDVLEAAKQAAAKKPGETAPPSDKPEPKADPADEGGGKDKVPEKAPEKPTEEPAEG
jgi:S1-C subfamily serine protease